MQIHYKALSYRIELYLHDYKLPIKIDENGHSDRNIEYKINQQKAIYQEFGCKFIRIASTFIWERGKFDEKITNLSYRCTKYI